MRAVKWNAYIAFLELQDTEKCDAIKPSIPHSIYMYLNCLISIFRHISSQWIFKTSTWGSMRQLHEFQPSLESHGHMLNNHLMWCGLHFVHRVLINSINTLNKTNYYAFGTTIDFVTFYSSHDLCKCELVLEFIVKI